MKEQEEAEEKVSRGHSGDEAKGTAHNGILAYERINETYKQYLARDVEEDKSK